MSNKLSYAEKKEIYEQLNYGMFIWPIDYFKKVLGRALQQGYPIDFKPNRKYAEPLFEVSFSRGKGYSWALLEAGADTTLTNDKGNTRLITAVWNQAYREIIQELLKTIDINHKNNDGYTAWYFLSTDFMDLYTDKNTPTFAEKQQYYLEIIKDFLQAGVDPYTETLWTRYPREPAHDKAFAELNAIIAMYHEQKEQLIISNSRIYEYEL